MIVLIPTTAWSKLFRVSTYVCTIHSYIHGLYINVQLCMYVTTNCIRALITLLSTLSTRAASRRRRAMRGGSYVVKSAIFHSHFFIHCSQRAIVMQDFLLFLFLILQTCAIRLLLAEENTFSTFLSRSIEDLPAALFDENLTSDGGQESNWENNVGLPTASNGPLADNTESQILGDERSDCIQSTNPPNPSRLRMRDQRNLFCIPPQEYREPTITSPSSSNTKKQGALLPSSALRLWPDLQQNTEMTKLWIQLNTIPGIDGEKNEEVCEQAEESLLAVARHVPVCFPHPYLLDSPSDVVQPCRLCK